MFPKYQVLAYGMAPMHRPPYNISGIILVEEMVDAVIVNQPIGVIHPFFGRAEMELGPVLLLVNALFHGFF
jgi:hypothetical protein